VISNESAKTFLAKLFVATNNMKFETADDLLTLKNMEVEENAVVEFAELYENLTDEQKSELIDTAKSIHREYVQEMMKRVRETAKPRMRIELSHKDSEGQVQEDQIQDAMELVERLNEKMKPEGRKMKLETVNLSLVSATA
jgi:hypothetical protein